MRLVGMNPNVCGLIFMSIREYRSKAAAPMLLYEGRGREVSTRFILISILSMISFLRDRAKYFVVQCMYGGNIL